MDRAPDYGSGNASSSLAETSMRSSSSGKDTALRRLQCKFESCRARCGIGESGRPRQAHNLEIAVFKSGSRFGNDQWKDRALIRRRERFRAPPLPQGSRVAPIGSEVNHIRAHRARVALERRLVRDEEARGSTPRCPTDIILPGLSHETLRAMFLPGA